MPNQYGGLLLYMPVHNNGTGCKNKKLLDCEGAMGR